VPAYHSQTLIAICQECGLHHPVIADACQLQNKAQQMPVADGTVEGKPVNVMRDTGYSTAVARRSLVPDGKLTGQMEDCILIDGTVRHVSVARIFVRTPYFTGIVVAVCMEDPLCGLIIGNISGAIDPLYKPGKGFLQRTRTNRRGQRTIRKDGPRRTATTDDDQT